MEVDLQPGSIAWSGLLRAKSRTNIFVDFVIHIGANIGQELDLYTFAKVNTIQIEPDPLVYKQLKRECIIHSGAFIHLPINLAISDYNGQLNLHRYQDSCHNSSLEPVPINGIVSDIVETISVKTYTINDFLELPKINKIIKEQKHIMLVIDTQGHESRVLSCLPEFNGTSNILSIYCETSHQSTYIENPSFGEINSILQRKGYLLDNVNFARYSGNALYCGNTFFEVN